MTTPLRSFEDTIAAISTPLGRSGIGIVRLTGPEAIALADGLFRASDRRRRPLSQPTYTTCYGRIVDGEETVDEVILTVMRAPRTYTTQDVVEINCHGGIIPLRRTLELVLRRGARLADPGEFTRRAFFFGRIDLAQAEAVADLINAQSEAGERAALAQLQGRLSQRVAELRGAIVQLLAHIEAGLDFVEDDVDALDGAELGALLANLSGEIDRLLATATFGRALREGLRVAIIGRPNVGKSSLLNSLLGQERAIVTPVPGTTRDVIEETLTIHGMSIVLSDTAGLRTTTDLIEQAGVARAQAAAEQADAVLLVLDGAEELLAEDRALIAQATTRTVVVVNKSDLPQRLGELGSLPCAVVAVSALTEAGLDRLREEVAALILSGRAEPNAELVVTNTRHKLALEQTREAVERAREALAAGLTEEYAAVGLREALDHLGEIVGATFTEEIINRIFDTFCVGK